MLFALLQISMLSFLIFLYLFGVVGILVFAFVVLFVGFGALLGTLLDATGLVVVVGSGVSADDAGVLVDALGQFVEVFAAVLGLPR